MTVLSAYAGHLAAFIPRLYTFVISTGLFVYFGIKMLKDGYAMDPNEGQEELEEVTQELKRKEAELGSEGVDEFPSMGFSSSDVVSYAHGFFFAF